MSQLEQFQWAIKTGDMKGVKLVADAAGFDANKPDTTVKKRTPLHYAADFGQAEVAKYLVSKGATLDVKDAFGITPLLAAVYEGHTDTVKYLVEAGASAKIAGPDGALPIDAAESDEIKAILKTAKK